MFFCHIRSRDGEDKQAACAAPILLLSCLKLLFVNNALGRLKMGQQFGKIAIDIKNE